ncbi:MAG: hypothetical protein IPO08_20395 [Xanthomonadales bacterium]|nr:hypothetical protein [Xanthomonadales bacterium]
MLHFPNKAKIVNLLAPAADAGGRTSAVYASLKNAVRAWVVVYLTQGAANTVQLDPVQATAVAGTGTKALTNNCQIFSNLDVSASDTLVSRTAAKTYTTDAGVHNKIVIFQIDPAETMDTANSFDCIGITTGASAAANITSAFLIADLKYSDAGLITD